MKDLKTVTTKEYAHIKYKKARKYWSQKSEYKKYYKCSLALFESNEYLNKVIIEAGQYIAKLEKELQQNDPLHVEGLIRESEIKRIVEIIKTKYCIGEGLDGLIKQIEGAE